MIAFIVVLIIGIILASLGAWYNHAFSSGIGGIFIAVALFILFEDKKPSAIDVYRGKTTLEITYKDGVPVDSVVVFKDK